MRGRGTIACAVFLLAVAPMTARAQRAIPVAASNRVAQIGADITATSVVAGDRRAVSRMMLGGAVFGAIGAGLGAIAIASADPGTEGVVVAALAGSSLLLPVGVHAIGFVREGIGTSALISALIGAAGIAVVMNDPSDATVAGVAIAVPITQMVTSVAIVQRAGWK